jgi:alkylated DNA repair dioxygenase AlkB
MDSTATQRVGAISYVPDFLDDPDAAFVEVMEQVEFVQRTAKLYGRDVTIPRKEAWYGTRDYTFSRHTFPAQKMPPVLDSLAFRAEVALRKHGWRCNLGCMVNRYEDGSNSVAWHSDDDHGADGDVVVVSISLGATRTMKFRRKSPLDVGVTASALVHNKANFDLAHGSALVMGVGVQDEWEHAIPKTKKPCGPRINLTFRGTLGG